MLKPKVRRPTRAESPFTSGGSTPMFAPMPGEQSTSIPANSLPNFNPPAAQSFNFSQGFQPQTVNNPFAAFSKPGGQEHNAAKRTAEEADDSNRKKTFGSFGSTTNSQSTSNMFGNQASNQTSTPFAFTTPSTGLSFGNGQAQLQPPTNSFAFQGTQAQPSGTTSSVFGTAASGPTISVFGQSQTVNNKVPDFGTGALTWGFNSTAAASTAATTSSIAAPTQPTNASFPSFGQAAALNQTPAKAASFTFGATKPQSTASMFSGSTQAPSSSTTLFGSTSNTTTTPATSASTFTAAKTPTAGPSVFGSDAMAPGTGSVFDSVANKPPISSFTFGDKPAASSSTPSQSSNMFSISPKISSQGAATTSLYTSASQPASSTPAASTAPATNAFPGFGTAPASPKPVSNSIPFTNGAPKESDEQTTKSFSLFGQSAKLQDNNNSGISSPNGLSGNKTAQPVTSTPFGTAFADKSQPSSNSSNMFTFGMSNQNGVKGATATPTKQHNGTNRMPLFGSTPSNQDSNKDGTPQSMFVFGQSQPSQTTQGSQPSSSDLFGSPKSAQAQPESSVNSKSASSENNGAAKNIGSSLSKSGPLFGNTLDSSKGPASSFMQKHKPTRPSPLSQYVSGSASPDTDRSSNASAFPGAPQLNPSTNGSSTVFESPSKPAQDISGIDNALEKKEYDAAKRLRALSIAVTNSIRRMPVTADLSKFLVFYNDRRREIMKDVVRATKRKAVDGGTDEEGAGPSPSKRQRQNNGQAAAVPPKSVPSGGVLQPTSEASSKDVFDGSATPSKTPSKGSGKPAQTPARPTFKSPMKAQSMMNGSTTPRGPPPMNLFAAQALKTPAPVLSKNPPQTEKPKSTTSMLSAGTSTVPRNPPTKDGFMFGLKPAQPSLFSAPNGTLRGSSSSSLPAKESVKDPAQSNIFASSVSKASINQASSSSQLNPFGGSPTKQPPPATTSSASQQSIFPPASTGGKRKASSQITKDDVEAEATAISTPNGKRQMISQFSKNAFEIPAQKTPSTPAGKRKAESQLTEDGNEVDGRASKTPKTSGRSETSMLFKTILDSPQQGNDESQSAPPKKMFSLSKSDDSPRPQVNPFASLGVAQSPVSTSTQTPPSDAAQVTTQRRMFSLNKSEESTTATPRANPFGSLGAAQTLVGNPKAFATPSKLAAPSSAFPSAATNNDDAPKSPFAGASNGFSTATSVFAAPDFGGAQTSTAPVTQFNNIGMKGNPSDAGFATLEQFRQKGRQEAEKVALEKALEEYDSEEDGDKAEWIKNWKENRAEQEKKAEELSHQSKTVYIPGKGFSFSSQGSTKDNLPEPADTSSFQPKSRFSQPFASSTDVSRASSLGLQTSANESVLHGQSTTQGFNASNNLFGHLSDSGTDVGKGNEADDESTSDEDGHDDEKRDPTYDPAAEPEVETPDSPVGETGPGIASAKKVTTTSALRKSPPVESSATKASGSLFDRIQRDSDGNTIRQIPAENKENTQPSSPFSFLGASQPADKTWNQNTPIKFGMSPAIPNLYFTAATPPAQKSLFDFSASTKPPATISGATSAPSGSLFGANATKPFAMTFGGIAASSSASQNTPILATTQSNPSNGVFGSSNAAPTSGLFGNTKPQPVFTGFGDGKPPDVGWSFGGQTPSAKSSVFASAAASTAISRSTTPGATTDDDSNAANEASGDPDAEHHEQLKLTESRVGEEDEDVLLEIRAKGLQFDSDKKAFMPKGVGYLRVLKHRETGAARTLLRADPTAKIILNKGLLGNFNYVASAKTVKLMVAGIDAKGFETWVLQVKTEENAKALAKVLEEHKPNPS